MSEMPNMRLSSLQHTIGEAISSLAARTGKSMEEIYQDVLELEGWIENGRQCPQEAPSSEDWIKEALVALSERTGKSMQEIYRDALKLEEWVKNGRTTG